MAMQCDREHPQCLPGSTARSTPTTSPAKSVTDANEHRQHHRHNHSSRQARPPVAQRHTYAMSVLASLAIVAVLASGANAQADLFDLDVPDNLVAVPATHSRVTLSWTSLVYNNSITITNFRVTYAEAVDPDIIISSVDYSAQFAVVTGLMFDTAYIFTVAGILNGDIGNRSTVSANTTQEAPTAPMLNLMANATSVQITFTDLGGNYHVGTYTAHLRRTHISGVSFPKTEMPQTSATRVITFLNLEEDSDYVVLGYTTNTLGESSQHNPTLNISTNATAPAGAPANVNATNETDSSFTVQWEDIPLAERNSRGPFRYEVSIAWDSNSDYVCPASLTRGQESILTAGTSVIINDRTSETVYNVSVRGISGNGSFLGPYSSALEVSTGSILAPRLRLAVQSPPTNTTTASQGQISFSQPTISDLFGSSLVVEAPASDPSLNLSVRLVSPPDGLQEELGYNDTGGRRGVAITRDADGSSVLSVTINASEACQVLERVFYRHSFVGPSNAQNRTIIARATAASTGEDSNTITVAVPWNVSLAPLPRARASLTSDFGADTTRIFTQAGSQVILLPDVVLDYAGTFQSLTVALRAEVPGKNFSLDSTTHGDMLLPLIYRQPSFVIERIDALTYRFSSSSLPLSAWRRDVFPVMVYVNSLPEPTDRLDMSRAPDVDPILRSVTFSVRTDEHTEPITLLRVNVSITLINNDRPVLCSLCSNSLSRCDPATTMPSARKRRSLDDEPDPTHDDLLALLWSDQTPKPAPQVRKVTAFPNTGSRLAPGAMIRVRFDDVTNGPGITSSGWPSVHLHPPRLQEIPFQMMWEDERNLLLVHSPKGESPSDALPVVMAAEVGVEFLPVEGLDSAHARCRRSLCHATGHSASLTGLFHHQAAAAAVEAATSRAQQRRQRIQRVTQRPAAGQVHPQPGVVYSTAESVHQQPSVTHPENPAAEDRPAVRPHARWYTYVPECFAILLVIAFLGYVCDVKSLLREYLPVAQCVPSRYQAATRRLLAPSRKTTRRGRWCLAAGAKKTPRRHVLCPGWRAKTGLVKSGNRHQEDCPPLLGHGKLAQGLAPEKV